MDNQEFIDLNAKKLSGQLSDKESDMLDRYIQENPKQQELVNDMFVKWEASSKLELHYVPDVKRAWENFIQLRSIEKNDSNIGFMPLMKYAAAVLLVIGLGFLVSEWKENDVIVYTNVNGDTSEILLSDGSKITLNEGSRLSVFKEFNQSQRLVQLEGEAFFEVAKDKEKPFIIETGKVITKVLGTSFNIKANQDYNQVSLNVVSGKVAFYSAHSEMILTRGMAANYSGEEQVIKKVIPSENQISWYSKKLIFKDSPLSLVIPDLEKHFKVKIDLENKNLKDCRFTGSFEDPDLPEMLKILSITLDVAYSSKTEKRYKIFGQGCAD